MAWRRPGDKPSSELMMAALLTLICVTRPHRVRVLCALDWFPHGTTHIKENLTWHVVQEQANGYEVFRRKYIIPNGKFIFCGAINDKSQLVISIMCG